MSLRRLFPTMACLLLAVSLVADEPQKTKTDPDHARKMKASADLFRSKVRAILSKRCLDCHGGESLEGGFNIASRAQMLKGGESGPAVVPGKAAESRLMRLITHAEQPHMPYDEDPLPKAEIGAIRQWIDLGAAFDRPLAEGNVEASDWTKRTIGEGARDFWSFQPLSTTAPPTVRNVQWCRTPADRFVVDALAQKGIAPAPEADRRTLIRRVHFGLIGLPPEPDELQKYLDDSSADWYLKMVGDLLESPHFGERQARWWLDVARFAESHGFEQDYDRDHAWHYRDFVIKAFNADMPFDQFVRWQLAGDEIAPKDPLALSATGFLGAGVFPTQLTEKEFEPARYDELDDMVSTMGSAMLGLTIGCARCHDHKFDPIPSADYYRLVATFGQTIRSHMEVEVNSAETQRALAVWNDEHAALLQALRSYEQQQLPAKVEAWLQDGAKTPESAASGWLVLHMTKAVSAGGATLTLQPDESVLATGTNPDFDTYTLSAETRMRNIRAIRLEALAHKSMTRNGPGRASNGNMGVGQITVTVEPVDGDGNAEEVKLTKPRATFEQNNSNLAIAASIDGQPRTGWAVDPQFGRNHAAAFEFAEPIVGFDSGTRLTVKIVFDVNNKHNIGRPRLSVSSRPDLPLDAADQSQAMAELLALVQSGASVSDPKQRQELVKWYRTMDPGWQKLQAAAAEHEAKKPKHETTTIMVSTEGLKPLKHNADGRGFPHFYKETFFLRRGDAAQKVRTADPGFLQVVTRSNETQWSGAPAKDSRTSLKRRTLAHWITDTENGPGELLARVIVNRLWKHHLGQGIVSTPNDFGSQGARPTHPELLDWLARRLIDSGWKLKSLHRLIVSSAVYRQKSEFRTTAAAVDPENTLCWRFTPRRLEAEEIRDGMLAVSGQLDRTQFGKGTLHEGQKRRSIYFMIKRSKLIPMMQIFDAPEPLVSVGRRPSTTIASQALMFMNSPHVRGFATGLANRSRADTPQESIRRIYVTALCRPPSESELAAGLEFLKTQAESYLADRKSAAEAAGLAATDLAQTILSLNEFIFIE